MDAVLAVGEQCMPSSALAPPVAVRLLAGSLYFFRGFYVEYSTSEGWGWGGRRVCGCDRGTVRTESGAVRV